MLRLLQRLQIATDGRARFGDRFQFGFDSHQQHAQRRGADEGFAQEKLGLSQKVGEINMDRLNVNGGAIALGHPVGATGTRIVLTLMKEMKRRDVQYGLATLCIGGGQGGSMILEREG